MAGDPALLSVIQAPPPAASSGALTLLGTLTTTSGSSQSLTSIASGYREFYLEFDGVSINSAVGLGYLTVALSASNGTSYGTAVQVTAAVNNAADAWYGTVVVYSVAITGNANVCFVSPFTFKTGSGTAVYTTVVNAPADTAGAINALRISNSGSQTFDAGSVRVYGLK